jgi:hypothetical protein
MRHLALAAAPLALAAALSCGRSSPPPPPSRPVDLALLAGIEADPGAPLDADPQQVAVAFDGAGYLAVWSQPGPAGDDLYGARVSASGELLGPAFPVSRAQGDERSPAVAFDGTSYLVVWQDHRDGPYLNVYGARVTIAGEVLDPEGLPIDTQVDHQLRPAIAFGGTDFLVVWADRRTGMSLDVYGARVARDGTVLDGAGFPIASGDRHQDEPAVAFDGTSFVVAWQDQGPGETDLRAARVSPAGVILDPAGFTVSGASSEQTLPAVAAAGGNAFVAWQDFRAGTTADVYAARIAVDGTVLDPAGIPVATGPADDRLPALAFDGRTWLAVWARTEGGETAVHAARLDAQGTPVDASSFEIARPAVGRSIALASDGAGRALALFDFPDAASGAPRLRARLVTSWATLGVEKAGRGGGAVASAPEGIDCGAACSAPFDAGTVVSLAAVPDADSVFGGWSGACSGAGPCAVPVDQDRSVTASFLALYRLDVALGSGTPGTVESSPAGISCGEACSARFPEGAPVDLQAKGIPGTSVFGSWSGACDGPGACRVLMDGPRSVLATFLAARTVTIAPFGTGVGTLSLGEVVCPLGSSCPVDVVTGTDAIVTASPDASSVLKVWTGCTSFAQATCTVAASTTARYVSARFEPAELPLTAMPTGTGAGTITGAGLACTTGAPDGCLAQVPNPANSTAYGTVTLRAAPSPGSVFKAWTGCTPLAGDPAACTLLVNGPEYVGARFEPAELPLTAMPTGTGAGTITGAGLACTTGAPDGCLAQVPNPANSTAYGTVTLRAAPSPGSVFKAWTGCTPLAGDPAACTLLVNGPEYVSARFEPAILPLTVMSSGGGGGTVTVAAVPCTLGAPEACAFEVENPPSSASYQTVTLTVAPDGSSVFKGWVGCTAVASNPLSCTLAVNGPKYVTARLEPSQYALNVSVAGPGAVAGGPIACTAATPEGCSAQVANGATVTLAATADEGHVFKSWTGCTSVSGATCTVTMASLKYVSALFQPATYPLGISFAGTGSGTVLAGPEPCPSSTGGCTLDEPNGATVTLAASPDGSSSFGGWSGSCSGSGACTVTMSTARYVRATFASP